MSRDDIQKFSAGTMDKTIEVQKMQLLGELLLDSDSYNLTAGIQQGLGPRYGLSPIPGQADAEVISGTRMPGLRAAEGVPAAGYSNRLKVLAILPMSLGKSSAPSTKVGTYLFVVTRTGETIDTPLASLTTDISANIYDGLPFPVTDLNSTTYYPYFTSEAIPSQAGSRAVPFASAYAYTSGKYYASATIMSVSGADVPLRWYVGGAATKGDATHAPDLILQKAGDIPGPNPFTLVPINLGIPSEYNLQNYNQKTRSLNIFTIRDASGGAANAGEFNTQYTMKFNPSATTMQANGIGDSVRSLNIDEIVVTSTPVAGDPTKTVGALVEDPECRHNTSYKAALIASDKATAVIFQDSYSAEANHPQQWVDLTQLSYNPPVFNSGYVEDTRIKQSPFTAWPAFIRGTAMTDYGGATAAYPTLGAANTGVLRSNTVYEFTYAVYNKRLNFETNVCPKPVKFQVGATDFASLVLFNTAGSGGIRNTLYATMIDTANFLIPFDFSNFTATGLGGEPYISTMKFLNFYQYKFYYRQEGTSSWLPALVMDAAQWWFFPHIKISACTGAIASLPGGEPGAFNDYSNLSPAKYTCAVSYKDRAWWFSEKSVNFSLRNNIFAYPGRNSINAASGSFRGGIVHNYPGQAEQSSRLIIFGSNETYVARFSGVREQANVQVSADSSGVFDIDGSDLVIDPWTSVTAFSYRSAVVADGILFWWGPQGVYRDDGVATPTKVSGLLEPEIFQYYDPNKTDEVCANYNAKTKEITWFYPPKSTSDGNYTRTLVYNTDSGIWGRGQMTFKVDWAQNLTIDSNIPTAGNRVIAGVRLTDATTVQRAYFFDERNRAGDMCPTKDWMVKTITTPSVGVRRLTLAAGYDAANFATIAVGDSIAIQQELDYTSSTLSNDFVATVAAINTGAGTLDITLPTGAVLTNASLAYSTFFPFWQSTPAGVGLNGFLYQLKSNYWAPAGVNGYFFWLYCYLLFKVRMWFGTAGRGVTLSYRTPTALALISDTLTLSDNSDGNFQVYHPLRPGNDNHEGQAIRFVLSGVHLGHEWVLQYLESHARSIEFDGDPLKRFEG
jgi:hypothetical protein